MRSLEHHTRLVDLIYRTTMEPELWPEVLQEIQSAYSGCGAILGIEAKDRAQILEVTGYDRAEMDRFATDYACKSFVWSRLPHTPEGGLLHDRRVMPETIRRRDVFANEWARANDTIDCAIFPLWRRDELTAFAIFARSPGCGAFDEVALDELHILARHLRRAVQLQTRLAPVTSPAEVALELLDRLEDGVIVVGPDSAMSFANQAALRMVGEGEAGFLLHGGRLLGATRRASAALDRLLAGAFAKEGACTGGVAQIPREGRRPLALYCAPLWPESNFAVATPAAVLLFSDMAAGMRTSAAQLRELFGLSAAEARLAFTLAGGASLSEAADEFGVAKSTVVSQLSAVFSKTQTSRQGELIGLLRSLPGISDIDA